MKYLRRRGYPIYGLRGRKTVCLKYVWAGNRSLAINNRWSDYTVLKPQDPSAPSYDTIASSWNGAAAGWTHFARHYERYMVESVKATIGMTLRHTPSDVPTEPSSNASYELLPYVAGAYFENSPGGEEVPAVTCVWPGLAARGGCRYLQQSAGQNVKRMKLNWSRRHVFGAGYRDEWTPVGNSPANLARMHVFIATRNGNIVPEGPADPPSVDFVVHLKIYCRFEGAVDPEVDQLVQADLT